MRRRDFFRGFIFYPNSDKLIFMNRTFFLPLSLIILLGAIAVIIAYLNLGPITHPIILHFDSFRGIDFSGNQSSIFGIFLVAIALTIFNGGLATSFWKRVRMFSYVLLYFNVFIWLLILVVMGVIISVN